MPHARKQIRAAVATAVTGLVTTGANVYTSRVYPRQVTPCLAVYTREDRLLPEHTSGTKQMRDLEVIVEASVKQTGAFDDTVDQIGLEVEIAVVTNAALLALVKSIEWQVTSIEFSGTGDQPVGLVRIMFSAWYRVDETDPATIIS